MKKIFYFIKECPLVAGIIAASLVLVIVSFLGVALGKYPFYVSISHPQFVSILNKNDTKPLKHNTVAKREPVKKKPSKEDKVTASKDAVDASSDASSDAQVTAKQERPTQYKAIPKAKARSAYYEDNDRLALTTDYPYVTVTDSYFDDAVFIGDSRVAGLHDYSGLKNTDFLYKEGISVFDLLKEKMDNKKTVQEALTSKQYKKIFLMIGVNELGRGYASDYFDKYKEVVEQLHAWQPDAVVFIMGMMHVSTKYSNDSDVFNNDNVNCRNAMVAELANGIDTFYLDMNEAVDDEKGGLKSEYTWDGIHLKAEYYGLWMDYMRAHGLEDDMFEKQGGQQ